MVKIKSYIELIKKLPEREHFIVIKKATWNKRFPKFKSDIIKWDKDDSIEISRGELFDLAREDKITEKFVIKVLMWGYPSGGRGNNIKELLKQQKREDIVTLLNKYKENRFIKTEDLKDGLEIGGLGLSTMSKFLYFLKINMDIKDNPSVILDQRIIDVVNDKIFDVLSDFQKITYNNAPRLYFEYLKRMNDIAKDLGCSVGQLEMFLFIFGNKFMLKLARTLILKTTEINQG